MSTEYLDTLQTYVKILKQRNALLLRVRDGKAKNAEVSTWDERLNTTATSLCAQRKKMLEEFVGVLNYLQSHYEEDVHVGLKYKPNLADSNKYLDLLSKTRDTDVSF